MPKTIKHQYSLVTLGEQVFHQSFYVEHPQIQSRRSFRNPGEQAVQIARLQERESIKENAAVFIF
jgi:hypothetical protein